MKKIIFSIVVCIIIINAIKATNFTVTIVNFTYSPALTTVNVGDVVTIDASTLHPLVQVSAATWNANLATPLPGGWGVKTSNYTFTITTTDTIYFVCQNHVSIGMKGRIVVSVPNSPPVFTSTPVTTGTQGIVYTYNITCSDPNVGNTLTITCPTKPSWLTFTATGSTAVLTGTPGAGNVGNNSVVLQVTDGIASPVQQSFTIVVAANSPPSFTSTPVTSATQSLVYTYNITCSDPNVGNVLTITCPTKPSWLTFTPSGSTAVLTGTPGAGNVGNNSVVLQVTDGIATPVQQSFTIVVIAENPPSFTSSPVTAGTQGIVYTYNVTCTDPDAGNTLTITCPTKPSWLTFTPTGSTATLTGTPGAGNVGNNSVVLQVTDGIVSPVQQSFTIVVAANSPPQFTSSPVTNATQSLVYTYNITCSDPNVGNVLTITCPTKPSWLTFTPSGSTAVLTGTPGAGNVGNNSVVLQVTDGIATPVMQSFTIVVVAANQPSFTTTPVTTGTQGVSYTYNITCTDPDVGNVLTITCPTKPSWLTFTSTGSTAVLTGTPGAGNVGSNPVVLQVTDGITLPVQQSFTIVVAADNPPSFTSTPITTGTQGIVYTYNISCTDPDVGNVLTITCPTKPSWLTFTPSGSTAVLTGTPGAGNVGNNSVVLQVTDGIATPVQQSFTIVVTAENPPSFTSTPITTGTQGIIYTYNITCTDPDAGNTLTITCPTRPSWLTFTPSGSTATLTGTPGAGNVGNNSVVVQVTDGIATPVQQSFTIVVTAENPPSFTSTPITAGTQGIVYTYNISCTDPD
ncbi:MAG: putative Ig domain-containing protein, partial [Bacteroidia bacterium]|nr:putative Ig domain-containing protein [Bacteroidia bacterium]